MTRNADVNFNELATSEVVNSLKFDRWRQHSR